MRKIYIFLLIPFILLSLGEKTNAQTQSNELYAQVQNEEEESSKPVVKIWTKEKPKTTRKNFTTTFLGIGGNYLIPYGQLEKLNDNAIGFNLQLESRRLCNLWWGLRADYFALDSLEDQANNIQNNFKSIFTISPSLKYVFCGSDCQKAWIKPYVNALVNVSSIRAIDEKSTLGFGLSGGGGVLFPFHLFGMCWGADLNALFAAPNCIYRADGRENIQYINVGLTLSVGL